MLNNPAFVAYARSLIWVGLLIAISLSVMNIVALVLFDFIHGNPHRTHENALTMMVVFPPFFVIVALIGVILIFGLTQCLQAVVADFLMRRFGRLAQFAIILALPATTVLAWYCYEYLTPTDFYLGGRPEGWRPYQHGLTQTRYLVMLIAQTLVTLFSPALQRCLVAQGFSEVGRFSRGGRRHRGGGVKGHQLAEDQAQLLTRQGTPPLE